MLPQFAEIDVHIGLASPDRGIAVDLRKAQSGRVTPNFQPLGSACVNAVVEAEAFVEVVADAVVFVSSACAVTTEASAHVSAAAKRLDWFWNFIVLFS